MYTAVIQLFLGLEISPLDDALYLIFGSLNRGSILGPDAQKVSQIGR